MSEWTQSRSSVFWKIINGIRGRALQPRMCMAFLITAQATQVLKRCCVC
jgi:hypothetical protein